MDVVEVVRCKDCKYSDYEDMKKECSYCFYFGIRIDEANYCSYGERAEE